MANESGKNQRRIDIHYWDGVNAVVSRAIARKQEFRHLENARTDTIGTIEKRPGQVVVGTGTKSPRFVANGNFGLIFKNRTSTATKGLYRISYSSEPITTFSISISDKLTVTASVTVSVGGGPASQTIYPLFVTDNLTLTEPSFVGTNDTKFKYIDNLDYTANIYELGADNVWDKLSDTDASNIPAADFSSVIADDNMYLVNGRAYNRYVKDDNTTIDSTTAGNLFGSPRARLVNFYKNRIYLANFVRNGVHYKTSVLRSSYPLGIIALVNGDVTSSTTVTVTDTKYFYIDSGMNSYEVYRGGSLIATLTVTAIQENSVTVSAATTLLSSDEIWIAGTFNGAPQHRWANNSTAFGADVKQYDTFKLSGGNDDEITLMDNIGNVELIGSRRNLATWNDYTLEQIDLGLGCVSPRGYVKAYGTLYFLDYTGVYATSGGVPSIVSSPIQPYIDGATKAGKEKSTAGKKGRSVFFTLGTVTLYNVDGSVRRTLIDTCVEYNILQQNWYIHTNVKATEFETFIDTLDADRLVFTDNGDGGFVKSFLEGTTDDGKEIFFQAETQPLPLADNLEELGNPTGVVVDGLRGNSTTCYVSFDDDGIFYQVEGKVSKDGPTVFKLTSIDPAQLRGRPPVCSEIALSFRDSSKQICKLGSVAVLYLPSTATYPDQ